VKQDHPRSEKERERKTQLKNSIRRRPARAAFLNGRVVSARRFGYTAVVRPIIGRIGCEGGS